MTQIHDQALPAGTQLGVYEIKDILKIGAFEITYRAWNHHLKEQVEIQEYFPRDFAVRANIGFGVEPKSPDDREYFEYGLKAYLNQGEVLTQIEHPNIAGIENFLQLNGTVYLIRAQQEGLSLAKLIQPSASLAETELKFILVSILNALLKVHECNIVHGGIQPAAIFLGKNGEPLLTHFATARLAMAARMFQLDTELARGYAPVEQYEQRYEPGPASDFYALGATLYYCMTHHQPIAAHDRVIAISKGESDPMALSTESMGTTYSAEWLQVINWMLQPQYSDRPQSAGEILARLEAEPAHDMVQPVTSNPKTVENTESSSVAKRSMGIGVMVGIMGLIAVGLWFGEETSEPLNDQPNLVAVQPANEQHADQTIAPIETPVDQHIALATDQSNEPEENHLIAESASSAKESVSIAEPVLEDETTTEPDTGKDQQHAVIESSRPQTEGQDLPEKSIDEQVIKTHLAAAEKAMKAVRFTTPKRDNAFKYYQRVLELDPDNAEALAGLQEIVDRYIQFIAKARMDGRLDEARLYLNRAESVIPDDSRLHKIRAELVGTEE